jgi:glycosyltransferase involved in cell wall biosynthesis
MLPRSSAVTDDSIAAAIAATGTAIPPAGVAAGATILQVLPALGEQGGVERGTVDVAAAIVKAGGRAVVASAGGPRAPSLQRVGACHVELPLDSKNPLVVAANVGRLTRLIRKERVDVVHVRSRAPAWSALHAARRAGLPFVTTFHGTYNVANPLKHRYNAIMAQGEPVIAISRFIAEHLQRVYGVKEERIRVIPRGVDIDSFSPDKVSADRMIWMARLLRLADGLPVVLLPGRLTRWKGQTVLIEAMARLDRRDVCCVLLGSDQGRQGYQRELERLIVRSGLGGVVRIVNHCDDMPAAYMLADVVVSASTDPEAFGRVMVEAQALGRPVIGTDHGGSRETVVPGRTGWLSPPGDAAALAVAMSEALALSAEARARMAEAAIAHVRANFTKTAMCARTLAVYDEVLEARGGRP